MEFWGLALNEGSSKPAHEVYAHLLEQVDMCEEMGLDGFFLAEHHSAASYSITPSPNLLLAVLAARTQRLRLGNMVTVLPYHHPLRVAEEARMLDALSGGRLELGWGRGSIPWEQVAYGVARGETYDMFETGIDIVHRLLTEENVVYDTKWWKGGPATALPEATQLPRPPEWLTATSRSSIERAARRGMNCVTGFWPESIRRADGQEYRGAWAKHHPDRPVGKFGFNAHVVVAETEAEALKYARPMLDGWLSFFVKIAGARAESEASEVASYKDHGAFVDMVSSMTFEGLIEQNVIMFGDVDQVTEQVKRLRDSGVDAALGWFQFGDLDYEFSNRSLRLFCSEVMPRVEGKVHA